MIFDLEITIARDSYIVDSQSLGRRERGQPLCVSTLINGRDMFLAIGEPEANFANDPDFQNRLATGSLRFFNPFEPTAFEPKNAALVVRFYVIKTQRAYRRKLTPLTFEFMQSFWNKCQLVLDISGYGKLPQWARASFENEIGRIGMLKSWRIKTTEQEPCDSGCDVPSARRWPQEGGM